MPRTLHTSLEGDPLYQSHRQRRLPDATVWAIRRRGCPFFAEMRVIPVINPGCCTSSPASRPGIDPGPDTGVDLLCGSASSGSWGFSTLFQQQVGHARNANAVYRLVDAIYLTMIGLMGGGRCLSQCVAPVT